MHLQVIYVKCSNIPEPFKLSKIIHHSSRTFNSMKKKYYITAKNFSFFQLMYLFTFISSFLLYYLFIFIYIVLFRPESACSLLGKDNLRN